MPNTTTPNKRYPLPHPDNPSARADVARIRTSIEAIDKDIATYEKGVVTLQRDMKNLGRTNTITLRVGKGRGKFPGIQHAVNHARTINRPAGRWINIIVEPGEYRQSSITVDSLDCVQILSTDETAPGKTKLIFTPDKNGKSHGILFYNSRRVRFSGFHIIGHGANTYRAIYLTQKSEVWSRPRSIIIENVRHGVEMYHETTYWGSGIDIRNVTGHGVYVNRARAQVPECKITGTRNKSWGLLYAREGGEIHARKARLANARCAIAAYHAAASIFCDLARIDNVDYGIQAVHQACVWSHGNANEQTLITNVKIHAVAATHRGIAYVPWCVVDKAKRGFYADVMGYVNASNSSARNISEWAYISYTNSAIEAWHTKKRLSKVKHAHTPKASGKPGNYDSVIRFH